MRTKLLKWMIETAVPFLNRFRNPPPWPFSHDQHRAMEKGSLGNDVAVFLDDQNLSLLPKYEIHDLIHVLGGFGATPLEELKLQAFMIGNRSSTFPGKVLFAIGLLIKPEYLRILISEYKRGKNALQLAQYDFTKLVAENTRYLQTMLQIS